MSDQHEQAAGPRPAPLSPELAPFTALPPPATSLQGFFDLAAPLPPETPAERMIPAAPLELLGASPFPRGGFPLFGFLASVYELASQGAADALSASAADFEPRPVVQSTSASPPPE